jgi:hypothetical protein
MAFILLKEYRYVVQIGTEKHLLRVEELVAGPAVWNGKFRLQILADDERGAETIYGASADGVAQRGAEVMNRR